MGTPSLADVHRRRLATQRLTSAGMRTGHEVVSLLTCVPAQDAPLAAWSLGCGCARAPPTPTSSPNRPATDGCAPTSCDPRGTSSRPRTCAGCSAPPGRGSNRPGRPVPRARTRRDVDRQVLDALQDLLAGPTPLTRPELTRAFAERGLPHSGEQMSHQLIVAELRCVICSGPPRGTTHTYVLADETVPPAPLDDLEVEDARRELTRRFVIGHGPASDRDLSRWSSLTLTQVRAALADLADELESVVVDGETLWLDPTTRPRATRPRRAFLFQTFDEAALTYPTTGFARRSPKATRSRLLSEAGGGIIVLDHEDVGVWKRTVGKETVVVDLHLDVPLTPDDLEQVAGAAAALAAFIDKPLDLRVHPTF